jgi:glycosyltransferase involved in cell wall biosynthesis
MQPEGNETRERLNVLIVTSFDLDNPAGGVNTMIRSLIDNLRDTCRIVVLEAHWQPARPVRDMFGDNVRYRMRLQTPYSASNPIRGLVSWAIRFPSNLRSLIQIIRRERIDIVHLHYAAPYQYYFALIRRLLGVPYVLTLHRGDVLGLPTLRWPDQRLTRSAIDGADCVVAVSNWLAAEAASTLGGTLSLKVIPNGVDIKEIDALQDPQFGTAGGSQLPDEFFLMVSNVTHYKAQDVLIRAWRLVNQRHPGLELLIVGERRELWDRCVQLIEQLGCERSVKMLGPLPRSTAINLMYRANAVIIPSRSEGLPYVLLEAGAVGVPVICSDIGPFTEVVQNESTAFVVPVENVEALAEAVHRVMEAPERAHEMGRALSANVRSDYSAPQMARNYLATYKDAIAGFNSLERDRAR